MAFFNSPPTHKREKGCLLLHGLTGTPQNLEVISKTLEKEGYLVKSPLLPGHGLNLKTLSKTKWHDWYDAALKAYTEVAGGAKRVYILGMSMGGFLAMKLAMDIGPSIKGVALIATPIQLKPLFRYLVIPSVRFTPLRFFIRSVAKNFVKSVRDPIGRELYKKQSLARLPSLAVFQTQNLGNRMRKELAKITQPLFLVHARHDHLSHSKGVLLVKKKSHSKDVAIFVAENSGHVATLDFDRDEIAKHVVEFFNVHI